TKTKQISLPLGKTYANFIIYNTCPPFAMVCRGIFENLKTIADKKNFFHRPQLKKSRFGL
ncbi:MAG: hypothetical protein J6V14_08225, partial [Clostridia bacterium]|nr:hypothetical protein [Clostridia bacterium]